MQSEAAIVKYYNKLKKLEAEEKLRIEDEGKLMALHWVLEAWDDPDVPAHKISHMNCRFDPLYKYIDALVDKINEIIDVLNKCTQNK